MSGEKITTLLLAAGKGSRLQPLTNHWPKCLMPIGKIALLEHWLMTLSDAKLNKVLVNLHYLSPVVEEFLSRDRFKSWIDYIYEKELLGTAGTIRENRKFIGDNTLLLIHADNWSQCNLEEFIYFHQNLRPKNCPITMMTFKTDSPKSCGIVELDEANIVRNFYEKSSNPPGNLANAAIYLIDKEALEWIDSHPNHKDFSTEVIPNFIGRIATWHNINVHRDIGSISNLKNAQKDNQPNYKEIREDDKWQMEYLKNPIHELVKSS